MVLPFAAGVLAFLTVVLLWLGLRGRMVTQHPVCRKCHFDLVGSAGAARCPECGADLSRKRAVRDGLRKKRRWAVALGLLMLLMFLATTGVMVLPLVSKVDLNQYKPTWLLVQEVEDAVIVNDAVLKELMARRAGGKIEAAPYRSLVAHALLRQADPGLNWSVVWGDLIEDAYSRGDATPEQMQTFLKQSVEVELKFRERVKGDDGLPYQVGVEVVRGATKPRLDLSMPRAEVILERGGADPIRRGGGTGGAMHLSPWDGQKNGQSTSAWFGREGVPTGKYVGTLRAPILLSGYGQKAELISEQRGELEVVGPGESTVVFMAGSASREKPRANAALYLLPRQSNNRYPGPQVVRELYLAAGVSRQDFDMAFRCYGYSKEPDGTEREWPLGKLIFRRGVTGTMYPVEVPEDFAPRRMRVVLKADRSAAEWNVSITEIWDGELVIEDVEVVETTGSMPVPRAPR